MPLRNGAVPREIDRRLQDGSPVHVFILPDARRRGAVRERRRHLLRRRRRGADALSIQHACRRALFLLQVRHLYPSSAPLESQSVRDQRGLSGRCQPVRFRGHSRHRWDQSSDGSGRQARDGLSDRRPPEVHSRRRRARLISSAQPRGHRRRGLAVRSPMRPLQSRGRSSRRYTLSRARFSHRRAVYFNH